MSLKLAFIERVFYFRDHTSFPLFIEHNRTPELSGECEASHGGQHMARSAVWQG